MSHTAEAATAPAQSAPAKPRKKAEARHPEKPKTPKKPGPKPKPSKGATTLVLSSRNGRTCLEQVGSLEESLRQIVETLRAEKDGPPADWAVWRDSKIVAVLRRDRYGVELIRVDEEGFQHFDPCTEINGGEIGNNAVVWCLKTWELAKVRLESANRRWDESVEYLKAKGGEPDFGTRRIADRWKNFLATVVERAETDLFCAIQTACFDELWLPESLEDREPRAAIFDCYGTWLVAIPASDEVNSRHVIVADGWNTDQFQVND